MKYCLGCGTEKPRKDFPPDPRIKDGLASRCLGCCERYRNAHRAQIREGAQAYREKNREALRLKSRERRKREPEKEKARDAVKIALRTGDITRGACEIGGNCVGRIEGHHDSYLPERYLDVHWLCTSHHTKEHIKLRAAQSI